MNSYSADYYAVGVIGYELMMNKVWERHIILKY